MSGEGGNQSGLSSNSQQVVTTSTSSGQMSISPQVQVQQQTQPSPVQQAVAQQQLHLQQATTTTALHGGHHQQNQGGNPIQQVQLIQQPLQNASYLQQLYNTQGHLLMPGNIALHQGMNPQLQVISTGKPFSSNQLTSPHMLTGATNYTTIPTSAANNQYIFSHLINSQPNLLQHQQGNKPGDIQKILSPQLGTQLSQGLWSTPNFFQSPIFIRSGQPEQQIYIQQPHNNTTSHQHFAMPLAAATAQLPNTSISPVTSTAVQQNSQQQSPPSVQQTQQQQNQTQHSIQQQQANIISIKTPATIQPKPTLQMQAQPSPQQQQQIQQQQIQQHLQQVTMHQNSQQIQMIPQTTTNIPQSISITQQQPQTMSTVVQQQTQQQQQPRQLTILPQLQTQIQPQPMQIVQTAQQPQAIRPNYSTTAVSVATSVQSQMIPPNAVQRPKIRKPGIGRGGGGTTGPPTQQQQAKQVFPRMPPNLTTTAAVSQHPRQIQPSQGITLQSIRVPPGNQTQNHQQQSQTLVQPLKTINLSALQPPNLPDATLTPLIPQSNPLHSTVISQHQQHHQPASQQLQQGFQQTPTQLPSPNISITPTNSIPIAVHSHNRKDDSSTETAETKTEIEKENTKSNTSTEEQDECMGKQKLPKAMVKPQVLTHVIEGFVIQEAAEPFPMPKVDLDEPPKKKAAISGETAKCELCGVVDLKVKFKKNKRFCSSACAKGMKTAGNQKHQQQQAQIGTKPTVTNASKATEIGVKGKVRKWGEGVDSDLTDETNSSTGDVSTLSPNDDQSMEDEIKVNPMKWDVTEVVDFVKSLPGCSEYANDFAEHEIDGQALLLLKEDHLMSAMNMKLGPALKLCAKIEYIRSKSSGESART